MQEKLREYIIDKIGGRIMLNNKEKSSNLEMFMKLITGHFNNNELF